MHTVLSGIRATGNLHLGNYLGAVKGMLELQENPDYTTHYMVADAHAVTTPFDVDNLRDSRRSVIIDYLAAGLDPEKSTLFLQSMVPAHFELFFLFSSVMTVARMQHLPTYKEKVAQYPESATMALLNYPVLMAADILVYKADSVPVGIDQEPHIEIAREVARKLNTQYGTDFPEPKRFATKGEYVPSLSGTGKMSKSVEGSYISLTDDLSTIQDRLKAAPTDSGKGVIELNEVAADANTATAAATRTRKYIDAQSGSESTGVGNLLQLVALFQGEDTRASYESAYQSEGIRYGDLKKDLAEAIFAQLQPLQEKRAELESQPDYVTQVIREGAQKAQEIAGHTVEELKSKMGLGRA